MNIFLDNSQVVKLSLQSDETKQRTGGIDEDEHGCEAWGREETWSVRVEPEANCGQEYLIHQSLHATQGP